MFRIVIFFFTLFCFASCTPKVQTFMASETDIVRIPQEKETYRSPCNNPNNYAPDTSYLDHTPMKYIKLNIHYMFPSEVPDDFDEKVARKWAKSMYYAAQEALMKNLPSKLPKDNLIPTLPIRHRYVLTGRPNDPTDDGIYFHFDSKCCYSVKKGKNSTLYKRDMFEEYGIQKDTVLNIFLSPHHPDSVKSKTYGASISGVALRNFIKMMWTYGDFTLKPWAGEAPGTFNHEVGHIYGLVHAWGYNDGCDDTPKHSLDIKSNNVMDYNSNMKAWTPCQIGKTQMRMATSTALARKFLVNNWCRLNVDKSITITDSIDWKCKKDLEGNLIIKSGGVLRLWCRLSIPPNGKIVVEPGGKLIVEPFAKIHQACGEKWKGIEIVKFGKEQGIVQIVGEGKIEDSINGIFEMEALE